MFYASRDTDNPLTPSPLIKGGRGVVDKGDCNPKSVLDVMRNAYFVFRNTQYEILES